MPALALTDLANLFGLIKFYRAARARRRQADRRLRRAGSRTRPSATSRFARCCSRATRAGYLQLCDWLSRAYRTQPASRPRRAPPRVVRRRHRRPDRAVGRARRRRRPGAAAGQRDGARERAARAWAARVPASATTSRCSARDVPTTRRSSRATVALAGELALPVVATHPVQFLARDDFRAHEARVCIAEGDMLADPRRPRRFTPEQYFKTQARDGGEFADLPEALANTVEIAQRCNLTIALGKNHLPDFPDARGRHASTSTCATRPRRASSGASRSCIPMPQCASASGPSTSRASSSRSTTIVQMGFAGYFLIVADFINWAQAQRRARWARAAARAPARWSRTRSASPTSIRCATTLLFERFLNPERVSMPDFDIDFCQDGRDRVIDYVQAEVRRATRCRRSRPSARWPRKAAVRDVGRVLDMPYAVRRRHRQADSVPAGQARHARAARRRARVQRDLRARSRAADRRARGDRGGSARAARARRAARGPGAQRRHARRRRADRARASSPTSARCTCSRAPTRSCRSSTRTTSRRSAW